MFTLVVVGIAASRQAQSQERGPMPTSVYPNTEEGLRQLLQEVRATAKSGVQGKVAAFVKEMEIPDYETWFTTTFGQERGESWANPYGAKMEKNNRAIEEVFGRLAKQDGEFIVHKLDEKKLYGADTPSIDIYFADWKAQSAPMNSKGEPIGPFVFLDGKFRWEATSWFPSSKLWFPNGEKTITGNVVPAKLIKKVEPVYPDAAAVQHVSGTVRVYYVIGADGAVYNAHAISGEGLSENPSLRKSSRGCRDSMAVSTSHI